MNNFRAEIKCFLQGLQMTLKQGQTVIAAGVFCPVMIFKATHDPVEHL